MSRLDFYLIRGMVIFISLFLASCLCVAVLYLTGNDGLGYRLIVGTLITVVAVLVVEITAFMIASLVGLWRSVE